MLGGAGRSLGLGWRPGMLAFRQDRLRISAKTATSAKTSTVLIAASQRARVRRFIVASHPVEDLAVDPMIRHAKPGECLFNRVRHRIRAAEKILGVRSLHRARLQMA